jgi:hypothetical protein
MTWRSSAPQRSGEEARARGRGNQGEGFQGHAHRASPGAGADHEIEAEVLEGGIEDLFHLGVEAVDLVDEENLAVVEGGEQGGEIARPFHHRPRRGLDGDAQFVRYYVSERGLAHAGRPEKENVVERFAAVFRGLHGDAQVFDDVLLADVVDEPQRAQRYVEADVIIETGAGDEPGVFGSHSALAGC